MDPQLQQKIDEAKQAGYTDEEINQYLVTQTQTQPQGQQVPLQQPMDRTAEYTGTAIGAAGAGAAGAYGVKKLSDVAGAIINRGQPAPVAPVAPTSMAPAPSNPPTSNPSYTVPSSSASPAGIRPGSVLDNANQLVRKLALSKLLPAAQVGAGLFYTSPEEIATLKAAEQRRKQGLQ